MRLLRQVACILPSKALACLLTIWLVPGLSDLAHAPRGCQKGLQIPSSNRMAFFVNHALGVHDHHVRQPQLQMTKLHAKGLVSFCFHNPFKFQMLTFPGSSKSMRYELRKSLPGPNFEWPSELPDRQDPLFSACGPRFGRQCTVRHR